MSEALKPCPFCGGEAKVGTASVYCDNCPAIVWAQPYSNIKSAISAWNRRTQQPNEPLTLDELREMDGEPVWVESHGASFTHGDGWYISANKFHLSGYGKTWLAYRRSPEAGEKE